MKQQLAGILLAEALLMAGSLAAQQEVVEVVELSDFPVFAGSFGEAGFSAGQLSERMAREVRVDLQSRGGARYQNDISIRGGIFEGTGVLVGGLALFDPQTGHYFSEVPLDPGFFSNAQLLTGVANGLHGFNSTAGAIDWQWGAIKPGGTAYLQVGTDSLVGGGARVSGNLGAAAYEIAVARETGDGSVEYGDFDLTRVSGRVEYQLGGGLLRLFGGYVEKFYGWPGMYTGFAFNETDEYAVSLLGFQWETADRGNGSHHRIGGYWRLLDDDYEYRRETPNHFFEHKTEVFSLQGDGSVALGELEAIYRWAVVRDELIRSTSLTQGDFSGRDYGEAALLLRRTGSTGWGEWAAYGGAALDTSNEDSTVGLPQVGVSASGVSDSLTWQAYVEYAETSQVPGYTVLKSSPSGLFGGNATLGRELADTIEAGLLLQRGPVSGKVVVFQRNDEDLADWVYDSTSPNARRAAAVDLEVQGIESWLRWEGADTAVEAGYAWLDKEADYGNEAVDASFYALNYARHRLLMSLEQRLTKQVFARVEGEYRNHPDNALRTSGEEALLVNLTVSWKEIFAPGWDLVLRGYNLTGEDFQAIPGAAAPGREGSATLSYAW